MEESRNRITRVRDVRSSCQSTKHEGRRLRDLFVLRRHKDDGIVVPSICADDSKEAISVLRLVWRRCIVVRVYEEEAILRLR